MAFLDPSQGESPGQMGLLAKVLSALSAQKKTDAPPSTNDPLAAEPQLFSGGVPVPRPRPPEAGANPKPDTFADRFDAMGAVKGDRTDKMRPASFDDRFAASPAPPAPLSLAPGGPADAAALPEAAAPAAGQGVPASAPAAPATQSGPLSGIGDTLGGFAKSIYGKLTDPNTAATRLALAAGFAGAPSFGTGMSRAFSAAGPAMQADRAFAQKQSGIADTYKALVAKGVPPMEALAAVNNPDVMKATVGKYFETKPYAVHDVTGVLGDKTPVVFDPNKGEFRDMAGKKLGGTDGLGGAAGLGDVLAPGVKVDPNATGQAYFDQFSKDVQAAAKAYMNGDVLPSGNPRQKTIANYAKTVAQRYAQDMGIPDVSDEAYSRKRKYQTELGSNSATSAGGQAKAFNQGIEHADALAMKLEKLANWDPVGLTPVAYAANWVRGFSTKQADLVNEACTLGQTLAGEVGKLFSGSAGGGVHEREMTRDRFNAVASPQELAGALQGTIETMQGGLKALEQRRDQNLGPNNNVKFVTAETEAKIAHIQEIIGRLRSGAAAPSAQAGAPAQAPQQAAPPQTAPAIREGATATNPQTGQKAVFHNGQWVAAQ